MEPKEALEQTSLGKERDQYDPRQTTSYTERTCNLLMHRFDVRLQEEAQRKEVNKRPLISTNLLVPNFESNL